MPKVDPMGTHAVANSIDNRCRAAKPRTTAPPRTGLTLDLAMIAMIIFNGSIAQQASNSQEKKPNE
jgi:hypothetical protein